MLQCETIFMIKFMEILLREKLFPSQALIAEQIKAEMNDDDDNDKNAQN